MGSNLQSFFFVGAFAGVMVGTSLFDTVGRKPTALAALVITLLATLASVFVKDYYTMLGLRIVQGFGAFATNTGCYLLALEFTPTHLRNLAQVIHALLWSFGAMFLVLFSYMCRAWQHIFAIAAAIIAAAIIPLCLVPESPRYQLVKGKEGRARETFARLTRIFETHLDTDNMKIEYRDYPKNYWGQMRDFVRYPVLRRNTLLLLITFFLLSSVSYGLTFSWSKLGGDIYTSMAFQVIPHLPVISIGSKVSFVCVDSMSSVLPRIPLDNNVIPLLRCWEVSWRTGWATATLYATTWAGSAPSSSTSR